MSRRRTIEVDQIADRLQDAQQIYLQRRRSLVQQLEGLKAAYDREVLSAEDWAVAEELIPDASWVDASGDPFLPVAKLQVLAGDEPDLSTLFRERVATLGSKG